MPTNPFGSGVRPWVRRTQAKASASTAVLGKGELMVDEQGGVYGGTGNQAKDTKRVARTDELEQTVPTIADLPSASFASRVRSVDVLLDYTRDAPGGNLRSGSLGIEVPEYLIDPNDPTKVVNWMNALAAARRGYVQSRTKWDASTTKVGMPGLLRGIGTDFHLRDIAEWPMCYTGAAQDQGITYKRPAVPLGAAVNIVGDGMTRVKWYRNNQTITSCFGTRYRPFDETPMRINGDFSPWGSSTLSTDPNGTYAYKSNGTGQAAMGLSPYVQWRYAYTPRSVMKADAPRGTNVFTVDFVDGIDYAWWSTNSLTATPQYAALVANRMKVGDWVMFSQGQNPDDTHEYKYFDYAQIVAINNNPTAGFTATGPGTVTLSVPTSLDIVIEDEFTAFPFTQSSKAVWKYLPQDATGIENIDSHSIFKIDQTMWTHRPYVGGIEFVLNTTEGGYGTSNAFIQFQSSVEPLAENIRSFQHGLQIIDYNRCIRPRGINLSALGYNTTSPPQNNGMIFDLCSSRNGQFERLHIEKYMSKIFQFESFSDGVINGLTVINNHPSFVVGSPAISQIGNSKIHIRDLELRGNGGILVQRGDDQANPFIVEGEVRIYNQDPNKRWQLRMGDYSPHAAITMENYTVDGTTPTVHKFTSARWRTPVSMPFVANSTQTVNLPQGAIRDGIITAPTSLQGLTNLTLRNGLTDALNLLGKNCVNVNCLAIDHVGDGIGTDIDRTMYSSTNEFTSAMSEGDTLFIAAFNPDGSDWVTTIQDMSGSPGSMIVTDLPPGPIGKVLTAHNASAMTIQVDNVGGTQSTSSLTGFSALTAVDIRQALENLPNVGVGNVQVSGVDGGPFTIGFDGTLGNCVLSVTAYTGGTGPNFTNLTVRAGSVLTPGKTTRLPYKPTGMWKGTGQSQFNLGKLQSEDAGIRATMVATFDNTVVDPTLDIVLELETYGSWVIAGENAPVAKEFPAVTGDVEGNAALASLIALGRSRGELRDTTINTGKVKNLGHQQAAATMLRGNISTPSAGTTPGTFFVNPFTVDADVAISNITLWIGTQFAGTTLARCQLGTYDDTTSTFTPLAESADQHTALIAVVAGQPMVFPFANTGRLAATPLTYTLKRGVRYAYSFIHVGSTAGKVYGNGQLTVLMANLTPAVARQLSAQPDAPAVPTVLSGSTGWLYMYGT